MSSSWLWWKNPGKENTSDGARTRIPHEADPAALYSRGAGSCRSSCFCGHTFAVHSCSVRGCAAPAIGGIKKAVKIKSDEIQLISKYIYGISGIHIEASKAYLLETRLGRLLEAENCTSYGEFYHKAKTDNSKVLEKKIVDAITTNETLFFRDASPFELLKHKILPEIIDRNTSKSTTTTPIRIWSAACSTRWRLFSRSSNWRCFRACGFSASVSASQHRCPTGASMFT